jgi:hypothetical protein
MTNITITESTDARNARIAKETRMYGCAIEDFRESIEGSITFKFSGAAMCIASLMSDAQEEMAHGMVENASQTLNRAKWALATYIMKD